MADHKDNQPYSITRSRDSLMTVDIMKAKTGQCFHKNSGIESPAQACSAAALNLLARGGKLHAEEIDVIAPAIVTREWGLTA